MAAHVTQQVFLSYLNHPERFDPTRGTLHSVLVAMAYQLTTDQMPTAGEQRPGENQSRTRETSDQEQPAGLTAGEQSSEAKAALSRLPTECRLAIEAVVHGKCTYQEAAVVLGIPEEAAKARIRRGMAQLRTELSDISQQIRTEMGPQVGSAVIWLNRNSSEGARWNP
jgi:RNA polymerase sigma-70 factor, ECF subfamily